MAILAVDEVMLREPRLLVPRMVPVGRVKLSVHPLVAKLSYLCIPGLRLAYGGRVPHCPTNVDVNIVGSQFGAGVTPASTTGDYIESPAQDLRRIDSSLSFCVFAMHPAAAARSEMINQTYLTSQYLLGFNMTRTGANSSGECGLIAYSGAARDCVQANDTVDGLPHVYIGNIYQNGTTNPSIFVDGVQRDASRVASSIVVDPSLGTIRTNEKSSGVTWLSAVFAPALTTAEIIAFSGDPFCIVEPA